MTDLERARRLFQEAGLAFPTIPAPLASNLKEQKKWLFSTRKLEVSPYVLDHYIDEPRMDDYAVLSHSGHGANSYAVQYYLVCRGLAAFLHLGWGGVYMDADKAGSMIRDCFALVDQIVAAAQAKLKTGKGDRLTIVASDFYGSYWTRPGESRRNDRWQNHSMSPSEALGQAHAWLMGSSLC